MSINRVSNSNFHTYFNDFPHFNHKDSRRSKNLTAEEPHVVSFHHCKSCTVAMERLPISDIMWNLQSGFQGISFKDTELVLIEREQQLKIKKVKMEDKYSGVRKENDALKKRCDKLWSDNKAEVRRRRDLNKKFHQALEKIRFLEKDATVRGRAETAERREKEAREQNARLLEKIKVMEEEKAEEERGKREVRGEIEKLLQKIGCLEKEKEIAFAEAENLKNIFTKFKERVVALMEDSGLDLSSTGLARLSCAYDGADADVDNRLDTNIKEESNGQNSSSPLNLSGQNSNLSTLVSGRPTNTTIIDINYSDSDDEGLHPPNGLKRKRDLSGRSSAGVVGKNNDENITIKSESEPPGDLSSGSVNRANHSVLGVASWYDQSVSRSITAKKCSDEKLEADASWQFEADMLSAIDKAPILTLEAVCALYRQQKSHGNLSSGSAFLKNRGFDGFHVFRGTTLAEFLLNGDPQGGMKKSLEELQLHDPKGLDDCKRIAISHSRQLFEIYRRQEDPFFGPK